MVYYLLLCEEDAGVGFCWCAIPTSLYHYMFLFACLTADQLACCDVKMANKSALTIGVKWFIT